MNEKHTRGRRKKKANKTKGKRKQHNKGWPLKYISSGYTDINRKDKREGKSGKRWRKISGEEGKKRLLKLK